MKRSSWVVRSIGIAAFLAILMTQTAAALPTLSPMPGEAGQNSQTAPAPPPPLDLLNAKRVFVQNNAASPVMYSHFLAGLRAWGRYSLVDSPARADVVFEVRDEPLSVVVVQPSTNVILATVSAPDVPPQRNQVDEETAEAENLVSAMKQFVGVPLSAQETSALTPPVKNKHGGLIFGCSVAASLAIAAGVVLLLHGRGHSRTAVPAP